MSNFYKIALVLFAIFFMTACGGGGGDNSVANENTEVTNSELNTSSDTSIDDSSDNSTKTSVDSITDSSTPECNTTQSIPECNTTTVTAPLSYKGLQFFYEPLDSASYKLEQLSDSDFNALSQENRLKVANKLLNTLFFGYELPELKDKINQGNFITSVQNGLKEQTTDIGWLESYILNDEFFDQYTYYEPQAITILTRFYTMQELDKYYLDNWMAYILTQTIMFSPAYELASTHYSNIANVYNRIVTMSQDGYGMRFITYIHMSSEDNWRRFRSPEDNGREMLEIYLLDTKDSDVPLAAKALQNWKLNTDSDTLEIGLNVNTEPISLFSTTIYTGDDFYRELVKSNDFVYGVTTRLVDFFFTDYSQSDKEDIVKTVVSSNPETWQDILLQIIFSKEYLLNNQRAQSAEETFFSLAKKMNFRHKKSTFYYFKYYLDKMNQATMKYKLGKLERVPLDSLSFANYHKFIREYVFLNVAYEDETDLTSWKYDGWLNSDFVDYDKFNYDENKPIESLENIINYIFNSIIARDATADEMELFKTHMLTERDEELVLKYEFNFCYVNEDDPEYQQELRDSNKRHIAVLVLDYISRLEETYMQREVK